MKRLLLATVLIASSLQAQGILWTDITSLYDVPSGIRLYRGERSTPLQKLFVIDVDLNNPLVIVRPYLSTAAGGKETLVPFLDRVGALAAVNGGYFGGSTSYSAVVYPGEVVAQNIASVTRSAGIYPVTRSFFGLSTRRQPVLTWIYHFGPAIVDLYRFSSPTANTQAAPAPAPVKVDGVPFDSLLAGIGGGPTLVKGGVLRYTYDEEVFFGSGIDGDQVNPRTAVGFTPSNHVILLTADGRQAASTGVTLPDLAQIMISLGCVEAMNLDGGGSTQMSARTATGGSYVNVPSESRAVPTMFAVVHSDSLQGGLLPVFEKTIDTGDSSLCELTGGWFASANAGWWGAARAQLAPIGTGESRARFSPGLPREAVYDVHAWWVAASNRSTNTPFLIQRKGGTDTVRVDQTQNGSRWVKIGTFLFSGDTTDAVTVTNAATTGSYVCADGLRLTSYDPVFTDVRGVRAALPAGFTLEQNYPNPFNPVTTIQYTIGSPASDEGSRKAAAASIGVRIAVYDLLGRERAELVNDKQAPGSYRLTWDASELPSGIYFCRMTAGASSAVRRMVLIR